MSTEAIVTRKCLMGSHHDFYRFIKNKNDLLDKYVEFRVLNDHVFLSKNGCPCNVEEHEKAATEIYKNFDKMNQQAFTEIKQIMKCSGIIFKLNGEILFEL